jgi:hypothetical protein
MLKQKACSNKKIERDGGSTKTHRALRLPPRRRWHGAMAMTGIAHVIVSGKSPRAARFLKSVVFKSFTLFPTFPFLFPLNDAQTQRGNRLVNERG